MDAPTVTTERTDPAFFANWCAVYGDAGLASELAATRWHYDAMIAAGWHGARALRRGDFVMASAFEYAADAAFAGREIDQAAQ